MPRLFDLSVLRTRCQRRADMENNGLITDAEWGILMSEMYGELCAEVSKTGMRYFETTYTYTTTGVAYVSEQADVLSTIRIDYLVDGTTTGRRRELIELMAQEQPQWSGRTGSNAVAFAAVDDRIYLYPTPPTGQSYEVLYIPQPPDLSAQADSYDVDLVTPDGESFFTWGVAVKALSKSESDTRLAIAEREAARVRFVEWCTLRAFNQPRRRVMSETDMGSDYDPADWRWR